MFGVEKQTTHFAIVPHSFYLVSSTHLRNKNCACDLYVSFQFTYMSYDRRRILAHTHEKKYAINIQCARLFHRVTNDHVPNLWFSM